MHSDIYMIKEHMNGLKNLVNLRKNYNTKQFPLTPKPQESISIFQAYKFNGKNKIKNKSIEQVLVDRAQPTSSNQQKLIKTEQYLETMITKKVNVDNKDLKQFYYDSQDIRSVKEFMYFFESLKKQNMERIMKQRLQFKQKLNKIKELELKEKQKLHKSLQHSQQNTQRDISLHEKDNSTQQFPHQHLSIQDQFNHQESHRPQSSIDKYSLLVKTIHDEDFTISNSVQFLDSVKQSQQTQQSKQLQSRQSQQQPSSSNNFLTMKQADIVLVELLEKRNIKNKVNIKDMQCAASIKAMKSQNINTLIDTSIKRITKKNKDFFKILNAKNQELQIQSSLLNQKGFNNNNGSISSSEFQGLPAMKSAKSNASCQLSKQLEQSSNISENNLFAFGINNNNELRPGSEQQLNVQNSRSSFIQSQTDILNQIEKRISCIGKSLRQRKFNIYCNKASDKNRLKMQQLRSVVEKEHHTTEKFFQHKDLNQKRKQLNQLLQKKFQDTTLKKSEDYVNFYH